MTYLYNQLLSAGWWDISSQLYWVTQCMQQTLTEIQLNTNTGAGFLKNRSKKCNHVIAWLHKMSENLDKIWTNERKTKKLAIISYFCHNLSKIFFMAFFTHVTEQILNLKTALMYSKTLPRRFTWAFWQTCHWSWTFTLLRFCHFLNSSTGFFLYLMLCCYIVINCCCVNVWWFYS